MENDFSEYCLVTGATGVIGRPVVRHLLEAGRKVLAVGQSPCPFASHEHLEYISLDLHDAEAVRRFFATYKPFRLIHLAWEATPGKFWHSKENFRWVTTSALLLDQFVSAGGRKAVLAGSCAEYGWTDEPLDEETSALSPQTFYSASKVAFRQIADVIASEIDLVWARIFFPYGPGEDPNKLISYIVKEISLGRLPEFQHPRRAVDFIYLQDVARIFEALAYKDISGPVNICSGTARLPQEIAIECAKLFDVPEILDLLQSSPLPLADVRVEGSPRRLSKIFDLKELKPFPEGLLAYRRKLGN